MSISSDEVNFLVYRYLLESGFSHSAFTFAHESLVARSVVADSEVPAGALVAFLQKGLQYVEVETHLQEDGTERPCDEPFHLLAPHICRLKYIPTKRMGGGAVEGGAGAGAGAGSSSAAAAASASASSTAIVPEIPSADVTILKGHTSEVFACAFHPTRPDVLATGSGDGTGRIWRLNERTASGDTACAVLRHAAARKDKDVTRDVASLDWSPSGTNLATGCYDGRARIWSAEGALQQVLAGHTQPVLALQWSPNSSYVLTGSVDKTAIVWDASSGSLSQHFAFHSAAILDVDWQSDTHFAACGSDKSITLCALGERAPVRTWVGHGDEVNAIAWSPARTVLASASDDGTAKLWSTSPGAGADKDGGCVATLSGHSKSVYSVEWAPTGEGSRNASRDALLATASLDSTVRLWDPATGKCRSTLARHAAMVYTLSFSPDGEYLVSGSTDRSVYVWRVRDGSLARSYTAPSGVYDVSFSAGGDRVSAACANGAVAVLDLRM